MGADRAIIDSAGNEAKVDSADEALKVKAKFYSAADLDTLDTKLAAIQADLDALKAALASVATDKLRVSNVDTVTVSGSVTVQEPLSIDDNGGSITVDGTVDVGNTPLPISDNGGSITIDDGGGSITVDASSWPLPNGAATESTLADIKTLLDKLEDALASVAGDSLRATLISPLPVPISDNGGSITVDGSVTVSGSVTIQEPLSIDDNGGSITIDGTVTAAQGTPQNLKALAYGFDGTNYQPLKVDSSGKLVVTV